MKLLKKTPFILTPKAPFNFDATFHKPSHFPSSDCFWEKNKYWQTMLWKGEKLGLVFENKKPKIKLTIFYTKKPNISELVEEIKYRYNLDSDLSEFSKTFKKDELLEPIIRRWDGMRPVAANSLYETLIIYIVLQNATVRRSVQMLENLFSKFGTKLVFDGKELSCFWDPKGISKATETSMRELKLGYRAKSVKIISDQFVNGKINELWLRKQTKETIKKETLKLYGVGPATVWYLLFEVFYFYDSFEHISPWEQKIFSKLLFNKDLVPPEKILKEVERRWGEYKRLASHYLFEDLFWKRKSHKIDWLEKEIRL